MSYGFTTHLWVLGAPEPEKLKEWLLATVPHVDQGDVEVWRLGNRVLLSAVNTSDHDWRWRSIGVVHALASKVKDFEWVSIDMHPDNGSWSIKQSSGGSFSWDEKIEAPVELVEKAKAAVRSIVPLELKELHHYVDWAHQLEDTAENEPAPTLSVPVHRISLGLPAAPPPPATVAVARVATSGLNRYWLSIACIVASALTVSAVQAPGPGGFSARLTHFLIQSFSLWLLGVGLMGVTSNGWPGLRVFVVSIGMTIAAGLVWALMPV